MAGLLGFVFLGGGAGVWVVLLDGWVGGEEEGGGVSHWGEKGASLGV